MAAREVSHDSVLLIAYGGPTRREEIRPFLDNVLRGRPIPKERYEEVVTHYEAVGGASPINELTFRQAAALRDLLQREGPALPVHVGMRTWNPMIEETLGGMKREELRHAVGIILAPHPSKASRESYIEAVVRARESLGSSSPTVDFAPPFFEHPEFIEALSDRLGGSLEVLPDDRRHRATVIYTAHSIPVAMSDAPGYAATVRRTADLVSRALGISSWSVAWQSRSGRPDEPWLEPDIRDELREQGKRGVRDVVIAPIGFVCDHVEVLYDLDIEARAVAGEIGLGYHRAGTAGDHPSFTRLLASLVRDAVSRRSQ